MSMSADVEKQVEHAIKSMKFRTNKKIKDEGKPAQYVPAEREMNMDDVLDARNVNGALVIVTGDGRKHVLSGKIYKAA